MLKTLILLFIFIPFSIWLSTMFSQFVSIFLIFISIGLGGLIHKAFKSAKEVKWESPSYLSVAQMLIIQGLIMSVIINIWGQSFDWAWVLSVSRVMKVVFSSLLALDLLILIILASIHGPFDVMGD